MLNPGETLLTMADAAQLLQIKPRTVYDHIRKGLIKETRVGKQIRIRRSDLDHLLGPATLSVEVN